MRARAACRCEICNNSIGIIAIIESNFLTLTRYSSHNYHVLGVNSVVIRQKCNPTAMLSRNTLENCLSVYLIE